MKSSNEEWIQCGEGQISVLAEALRTDTRHRAMKRRTAIAVVAALVVGAAMFAFPETTPEAVAARPISCGEVRGLTDQILDESLEGELDERVKAHLGYCQSCVDHVARARMSTAQVAEPAFTVASRD